VLIGGRGQSLRITMPRYFISPSRIGLRDVFTANIGEEVDILLEISCWWRVRTRGGEIHGHEYSMADAPKPDVC
jgi:hypothetical protein